MVSTIRNNGKAKLLVILLLVFTFSFMLTVQAFAEWNIKNKYYLGGYQGHKYPETFMLLEEDQLYIFEYLDDTYGYITGTSYDGTLTDTGYSFFFDSVDKYGPLDPPQHNTARNVYIFGKTYVTMGGFLNMQIKSVRLTPDYITDEYYTLNRF